MKKLALILFTLIIFIGCYQTKKEKIKIGAVLPLTGSTASYGIKIQKGIQLAKIQSDLEIDLIFEDSKSKQKDAVSALNLLINRGVKLVIGEVSSSNTLAIAPIAEKNKTILLSPSASNPAITNSGDYIFRIYPSDYYEGSELIKFIKSKEYNSLYSITASNDYGTGLKNVFIKSSKENKIDLIRQFEFSETEKDFRITLSKITNEDAAIVIVGYGNELGIIIKQARELGLKNQFFSTVNFFDQNTLISGGTAVEGAIFSALYLDPNTQDRKVNQFINQYEKTFNETPDIWSALGFDCYNILITAIKSADEPYNVENIKQFLYKLENYPGITGLTTFNKYGDVSKPINFMIVNNGAFVPYKKQF